MQHTHNLVQNDQKTKPKPKAKRRGHPTELETEMETVQMNPKSKIQYARTLLTIASDYSLTTANQIGGTESSDSESANWRFFMRSFVARLRGGRKGREALGRTKGTHKVCS